MIAEEASERSTWAWLLCGLLALALFALPLSVSINALAASALAVLCIVRWVMHRPRTQPRHLWVAGLWGAYLGWAAITLLWSRNLPHGLQDLRTYAPLAAVPLGLSLAPVFGPRQRVVVLMALAGGIALAIGLALAEQLPIYWQTHDAGVLFYHRLMAGRGIHPVFLAHLAAAVILIVAADTELQAAMPRLMRIGLLVLMGVAMVLMASRIAFAALGLTGVLAVASTLRKRPGLALGLAAGLLVLAVISASIPVIRARFTGLAGPGWGYVLNDPTERWPAFPNEFAMRLIAWRLSAEELSLEHAWVQGVGCGDEQDSLGWAWVRSNLWMYYRYHNAHSQYVQALLGLGVIGLLLLLAALGASYRATRGRPEARLWLVFMCIAMTTESTLVRQQGVMSFALLLGYLVIARPVALPAKDSAE